MKKVALPRKDAMYISKNNRQGTSDHNMAMMKCLDAAQSRNRNRNTRPRAYTDNVLPPLMEEDCGGDKVVKWWFASDK
ncbi:hypothetical protein J6590_010903 [Homalodisca vitripennis]|nr:hypothetical protein J6590_010903 [Homalodisca vitripennis]